MSKVDLETEDQTRSIRHENILLAHSLFGKLAARVLVNLFKDGTKVHVGQIQVRVISSSHQEFLRTVHYGILDTRCFGHLFGKRHVLEKP